MTTYQVFVTKTTIETATIEVTAGSPDEAQEIAFDDACDGLNWIQGDCEITTEITA